MYPCEMTMADRKSRKKQITSRRQKQILKAALEIFSRKGYAAATVPEIARSAGVATGTIYIYYPSKRELFIAVIKSIIITAPLLDLIEKIPKTDFSITFRQILQDRLNLAENEILSRMPTLMGEIMRDPELKAIWAEQFLQPFFTRMEEIYRTITASGKFRSINPVLATRAIGGLILGFIMLNLMEGKDSVLSQIPKDEVVEALIDFVLHGLANDGGEKEGQQEDAV
jgi:AcrR family transcriptional regulator